MKMISTPLPGLLVLDPTLYTDERGSFLETYSARILQANGLEGNFVQDNQSISKQGVIRALHFQKPPFAQGKLVRVARGKALDVAVDIRKKSPTYGQHFSIELTAENNLQLWIPAGFAHGFQSLEDDTIFCYKCTNFYDKNSEGGIIWNDPDLRIAWPLAEQVVAAKDQTFPPFAELDSPF
jgi:dTDP-4-dehydrorhamnose 3,5-epimerase